MIEQSPENSSGRMPPTTLSRQLSLGRAAVAVIAVIISIAARNSTYVHRDWISFSVLIVAIAGILVLEYRAHRDRTAGPPSIRA